MNKIIINRELCNGCKICYKSCFIDVITWDDEKNRPIEGYPEDCVQCMLCEANCPQRTLYVVEDFEHYMFPLDNILD
jgi:NAD-dependent dihydropyrimidine dehydrogenase PreA subunit